MGETKRLKAKGEYPRKVINGMIRRYKRNEHVENIAIAYNCSRGTVYAILKENMNISEGRLSRKEVSNG